ncbi:hypothetical protein GDO78_004382 [Eleutherodactylus coqui]|uniref:Uncharacterized protein n=1 Tax=Eleutherodactylus coqui TaxID=57060 RepID=A0A8J6ES08_ELECQ|nr:hypothetical protein GDO78_004382 [Eleutherodactylus coqui]
MKEMVGGCCVCSDERGWAENPLVYCDGHGCNVAVHQACYGIVQVPTGPWFCRKCESQERAARVRCDLCPHKEGALKRTDNGGWAHVVCALYIPEVQFANVLTMEPIVLQYVPHDRFNKTCYICEDQGRESRAASGACMTCNRHGCRQAFHVTCAQMAGLLCEEEAQEVDNVKYIGYCKYHYNKMVRDPQLESSTESPEVTRLEKGKKTSGHRGRKTGSGKGVPGAGSASSTGSASSPPELVTFPKLEEQEEEVEDEEEEEEEDVGRSSRPTPSSPPELTFSSFGSIMRFSSDSTTHTRPWDPSPAEHRPQKWSRESSEPPREKKHKGSRKSRHGPGRPRGSKNNPPHSAASSILTLPQRQYTHSSSLHSVSMESPLMSSGIYTSNKDPISVRTACSTPLPSGLMSHQSSLPPYSRSCSIAPSSTTSTTQVFSLAGSTFSIPSSHIFGSPLSMPPLLSQAENTRTEPELEDCSFICRGSSPRESLSSMSPISSLPPLYDPSGPSTQSENVPQVTANLEQLLEKHGEAGVNIVDMLQALHSLQKENRSLQDQILSLTARKEKLQLLNIQLSCPFPPTLPAINLPHVSSQDSLSNKSPTSKSSIRTENSPSEDQQNVLYQLVQQLQQHRDLQRLIAPQAAPSLLPVTSTCSTMASSPAPPILTAQAPPYLGSQGEGGVQKSMRGGEKTPTNHDKG